ncbi:hypothetical protein [Streptomyces rhizosphaericus]|uniref:Uncharacterized protein n=1 Tax=Streptomyces rhizosphaericus TaxID=114699 RepID=A0A6G4AP25_9ACTN|nr:hypothetical protein [Streptomyces rhizosphaericus]NEW74988.1 hypothetical protein [Streptomyces rhizosphaericus]
MADDRRSEILEHIQAGHGITRVTMGWLRNRYDTDWDKLSRGRADEIAKWLQSQQILHAPAELPSRETGHAMLYSLQSSIGILVAAARGESLFEDNPNGAMLFLEGFAKKLDGEKDAEAGEGY